MWMLVLGASQHNEKSNVCVYLCFCKMGNGHLVANQQLAKLYVGDHLFPILPKLAILSLIADDDRCIMLLA